MTFWMEVATQVSVFTGTLLGARVCYGSWPWERWKSWHETRPEIRRLLQVTSLQAGPTEGYRNAIDDGSAPLEEWLTNVEGSIKTQLTPAGRALATEMYYAGKHWIVAAQQLEPRGEEEPR